MHIGQSELGNVTVTSFAAHEQNQFHHFSRIMVQARLLKFFNKKTTEGMICPWLDILLTCVRDWDMIGELTFSNLRVQKHSLRDEAH